MPAHDAVVIGSGPNGLVAANLLVDQGWDVVLLEAQPTIGGAVRSDSSVHPGFVHDTYSSFYPLAAASPVIQELRLERYGLEWSHAPAVVGTPFSDGRWGILHRDPAVTAESLESFASGDGDAYLELVEAWRTVGDQIVAALLTPFPPVRRGTALAARLPRVGGLAYVRTLMSPLRAMLDQRFRGAGARMIFAGNALHADIPMDASGSGAFAMILTMVGQQCGFPVPKGGSGMLSKALADRFTSRGGEIRRSCRATSIVVDRRRATGVRTEHGDVVEARKAVLADVSAPALYGGLVAAEHLPDRVMRRIADFEWDPGTVKVDWALDGPVPWRAAPPHAPGTVHLSETLEEVTQAQLELANGAVPSRPFLVMGQMATADPTRAPATGGESLWAYTHVPQNYRRDAGDGSITGRWDRDDVERMADRMQSLVEEYAPGLAGRVVARRAMGPHELEAGDENLVRGALNGGTSGIHQELVFRPIPGLGRPETPVRGLFLASSSAHPGGGVHGACGSNAARAALAHDRIALWR